MTRITALSGVNPLKSRVPASPETVDRALITACAVIWLLALGMGVAATVALVDLGRGHPSGETGSSTPWLLYVIIAVSALVIALAIPLLLRARRNALSEAGAVSVPPRASSALTPAPSVTLADRDPPGYPGPMPARHTTSTLSAEMLDRMWLRCGIGVLTATGVAMVAVALAAYLLSAESDGGAWAALAVAGVITVAMTAIPVFYLRQLKAALDDAELPA
jgi:Protein of unknown function (DUF2561)